MQKGNYATRRRDAIAHSWALPRGAVLLPAGLPQAIAGTDQYHNFHAHPEHAYLAGTAAPGSVLVFDPGDGWTLFVPFPGLEERVWTGDGPSPEDLAHLSGIDRILSRERLQSWLESRRAEPLAVLANHDLLAHPAAYGIEAWAALELDPDEALAAVLSERIAEARRAKDPGELDLMRKAAGASARGHLLAMRVARPGQTERELQVEIEAAFFRAGGERTAYGSIVGSGRNGAILHVAPGLRALGPDELVLIDAGAECRGYASDVTRTLPTGLTYAGLQRDLYSLVLAVQEEAIAAVRPGVEYKDLHMQACRSIARGLVDLDILRGPVESLVERDAHALFFPHGLGHMLGLSTHDAGGCLAGRSPSDRFGLKWLRADLPLEPKYVVTIEPGIYFIPALLTDPSRRETFADAVNWPRVDSLLNFGGIRIEDDVLVTESGAELLSGAIPRSMDDIEALREEGAQL
ncbi:MAG: aminopeptidase P N-terminal domain-containing protein [Tepidiformaceae bacterium]